MTVYYVTANGEDMILKMHWPIALRKPSEIYFLTLLKMLGIKGVLELVEWEDAMVNGKVDCTNNI